MEQEIWHLIANRSGTPLDGRSIQQLFRFRNWLADEAIEAGGLGPHELERLDRRHISDSLLFSRVLPIDTPEVSDLGSGVGLPGIPLAILRPKTHFRLIDRSERRIDLMNRAVRVLGLKNVEVVHAAVEDVNDEMRFIVSRAALPAESSSHLVERLLATPGTALFGGSWTSKPDLSGWEIVDIGSEVLDHPVWLLIMRRR